MVLDQNEQRFRKTESRGFRADLFQSLETIIFALLAVILIFTFVFRLVGVDGDSMLDTLQDGDRLIVSRLFYQPEVGDIVIVIQPNVTSGPLVKRIIAMGGQTIDINTSRGEVYVDGKLIHEPYIKDLTTRIPNPPLQFPYTVPEGKVFVMGDNRLNSLDSRSVQIGAVDERYLLGKVIFRIFPFDRFGGLYENFKQ